MLIFTINAGSSSIRSKLIDLKGKKPKVIVKAHVDGIGLKSCKFTFSSEEKNVGQKHKTPSHKEAIERILDTLLKAKIIAHKNDIEAIGHRVVHGGEKYQKATKIDAKVLKDLEKLSHLAPLHNPHNIAGIKACKKLFPKAKQVAIFDTAFHQTIPEKAYLYGLPYSWYKNHGIRRYGFHGTSHKYVVNQAIKQLKKKNSKIISCHLGNGASVTASLNGKSIDTSMGFTPLEGVVMGTRSGSIDPEIIFHAKDHMKLPLKKIQETLNKESGLKGLFEKSSDMRDIRDAYHKKDPKAILTMQTYSHNILRYIGAYIAALDGLDALIFTGGIGEHAYYVRDLICENLSYIGVQINAKKNKNNETLLSTPKSKVKVLVIPTDEELQIAMETKSTLQRSR